MILNTINEIWSGMKPFSLLILFAGFFSAGETYAQFQLVPEEQVLFYTLEWEGERDEYGRPLVSDQILERMRHVGLEEAWGTIRSAGYHDKFEGYWEVLHPEQVMVGRALTATYMPCSPELDERMHEIGREQGLGGGMNQYP